MEYSARAAGSQPEALLLLLLLLRAHGAGAAVLAVVAPGAEQRIVDAQRSKERRRYVAVAGTT
jgi:hypothetical protein